MSVVATPPSTSDAADTQVSEVTTRVSDFDVLEQLIATNFSVSAVMRRLDIDKARIYAVVAANFKSVAQSLRAVQMIKTFEVMGEAETALSLAYEDMRPDDLAKTYNQLATTFNDLTKPATQDGGVGTGMNLNIFLGKLPSKVRGNVEELVDMDDDEFERMAQAVDVTPNLHVS